MRPTLTRVSIVLALCVAGVAAWWWQQPQRRAPAATAAPAAAPARSLPLIEVQRVRTLPMRDEVQATGTLVSRQSVSLRPQASGMVTRIHFKDGQQVRKGQVLLEQDSQLQRAQLQQAQAEMGLARANHQRNRELVAKGFISQRGLDESAADLQVAQARLALAQTTVERLRLVAPFDAVAGIGRVHVGDYLREGDEVVSLQDMAVMHVDFRLPERYLPQLSVGQPVQFSVDALPGETHTAQLMAIDPLIDEQGRSIAIRARLPNPQHRLRPGMFARLSLLLEERPDALAVPEEAVLSSAEGASVIRISPASTTAEAEAGVYQSERVAVQLGLRQPGWVEVREGLAAADVVMTAGQHRVSNSGQRLRVAQWPEDATAVAPQSGPSSQP